MVIAPTVQSGDWNSIPTTFDGTPSSYLTTNVTGPISLGSQDLPTVIFTPRFTQNANYTVPLYTPGCIGDSSCSLRGKVNITGTLFNHADAEDVGLFSTTVEQTNNDGKYDEVYVGVVNSGPLTVVAQMLQFQRYGEAINSTNPAEGPDVTSSDTAGPSATPSFGTGRNSPTETPSPDVGLSTGARAGLGVGITLVGCTILGVIALVFWRKRKAQRQNVGKSRENEDHGALVWREKPELQGESVERSELEVLPEELDRPEVYEIDSRALVAEVPGDGAR
ncbi:MAG: hypothetical protein M1820_004591 [Bogoriella megaspora]|nr:MAG: hypothetical protein M1820_004591 [Bogoriella megaspora]